MSGSNPALLINIYCKSHLHKDNRAHEEPQQQHQQHFTHATSIAGV
jgi:hypothetical protein